MSVDPCHSSQLSSAVLGPAWDKLCTTPSPGCGEGWLSLFSQVTPALDRILGKISPENDHQGFSDLILHAKL